MGKGPKVRLVGSFMVVVVGVLDWLDWVVAEMGGEAEFSSVGEWDWEWPSVSWLDIGWMWFES